ncbi:hypothetical protein ALP75_203016 [Pseudomonas syringae pv. actinidiae]|nr:hypothetical protein ALP75_203016 [Pseudomonas syringae pv. actinidiae]
MPEGQFVHVGVSGWMMQVANRVIQRGQLVIAGQLFRQPVRQAFRAEHRQTLLTQLAQTLLSEAFGRGVDRSEGLLDRWRFIAGNGAVFRVVDFQPGSTGARFTETTQVRAALHAFFLGIAEMVEAQTDDTGAVAKPHQ